MMLAWTVYVSFIGRGGAPAFAPRSLAAARVTALTAALAGLGIALAGVVFGQPGLTTFCNLPWVPSLGISYHLATDGISLTLILLTGIAAVAGSCSRGTLSIGSRSSLPFTSR